ncbi:hypothetical protein Fcan01_20942 [Folsomia candida]|uniref:Gustatory receptor n=1 Tax=Folsomia candida TaxID=158441 RepID=A0A226DKV3_FOLCA|nr:hypothetical protein Fcan01_20942 [Folsomia candida]
MDNFLRRLACPFSHSETSYIPIMTWIIERSLRSFSIPLTSEIGKSEYDTNFFPMKKIKHWVVYFCTIFIWLAINVLFAFWFYKNIYNSNGTKTLPVWQKVIAFYFLTAYVMIFCMQICLHFRKGEFLQVLKTCVWIEKKCIDRGASNYREIGILANLDATKMALIVVPILMTGLGAGYVWYSMVAVFVTVVSRVLLYPAVMVELWIKVLERKLYHSDFEFTKSHGLTDFRVAQVFQNLTNSVMRKPLVNLVVLKVIISQTISLYVIIASLENISFGVASFFFLIGLDFFLIIHVTLHSQSKPYVVSVKFFENMKTLRLKSAWFKKFLKSCPPLKVGMGEGKFFDELTSFIIWQFCVDRLINMLLLEK